MESAGELVPEGSAFLSARKLRSGGILYEMNSETSAKWLNNKEARSRFLEHFGPDAIVREHLLQVVVEYVPTTLDVNSPTSLTETVRKSGLQEGDIAKARWIKPLHHRSPNQRTAH
ncbi:hypothetical protein BV22DRAFT_1025631, partial [Leucogyrophana mollusca]